MKRIFFAALAAAAFASSASAQTVINITGATAFREAAHQAIRNSLDAGYTWGYQGTNISNASRAIFVGTNNGNSVIVRTSWSGSVAGIRAVVNQADQVSYIDSAVSGLTVGGTQNVNANTVNTLANFITFADNQQDNTPFDAVTLNGGPVGVVAFVPVVNETARIANGDNITKAQLQRLAGFGSAPLQFITGNTADSGVKIYWTGRQDTSGTRVIYTSELGLGYGAAVNQYRVGPLDTTTGAVSTVQLWPTGDTTNRSIIFRADQIGNGGYSSGGALAPVLQRTSSSGVSVLDPVSGSPIATNQEVVLVSVISAQEGQDIQSGGGKVLAYNGVYIEPEALPTGISATDKNKIIKGDYTLWSYENFFYRDEVFDGITDLLISDIETNIPGAIGGNGVPVSDMRVTRAVDGGLVVPLGTLP